MFHKFQMTLLLFILFGGPILMNSSCRYFERSKSSDESLTAQETGEQPNEPNEQPSEQPGEQPGEQPSDPPANDSSGDPSVQPVDPGFPHDPGEDPVGTYPIEEPISIQPIEEPQEAPQFVQVDPNQQFCSRTSDCRSIVLWGCCGGMMPAAINRWYEASVKSEQLQLCSRQWKVGDKKKSRECRRARNPFGRRAPAPPAHCKIEKGRKVGMCTFLQ